MSWATGYIARLERGETVEFRPRGRSMEPLIKSGQLVRVIPDIATRVFKPGDIVLCRIGALDFLHKILKIDPTENGIAKLYQIGNNKGRINGWIRKQHIFGVLTYIEAE